MTFQLIHRLFIVDLERAMERGMDTLLWTKAKQLVDRVREESGSDRNSNFENVVSLCISWLCDLSLNVYSKYQLPPIDIPSFICLSPALRVNQTIPFPQTTGNSFLAFLCLRLGDLFRYKGHYDLCSHLYHCSLRAKPSLGDAWNQLGVLAAPLDSLYFNTRALHCPIPFTPAAANISNLFRKYSDKGRCWRLSTVFIPHLICQHTITDVREDDCFSDQYLAILNQLRPDLLLCIALLLRVPCVCRNEPSLVAALSRSHQDVIFDSEKLETFRYQCFFSTPYL
uniref:EST1_DNA_bind domain-containing protein n=1 Tax=Angiostrongylus cantonensis TaxID=6313 RepID=A0A0K0DHN8_ANGCA